jgi:predicted methyltransferase
MERRMKRLMIALAAALLTAAPPAAIAAPADVAAAVAAPGRSAENVKLDGGRKPVELLNFLGLARGMQVIDMFGANRYWAEIIAPAVGPSGRVVVWQPSQFLNDKRRAEFAEFAARQKNVLLLTTPFETPMIGTAAYDFMLMNLDYHDVYFENAERKIVRMEADTWLKRLYAAMKPGGVIGIVDHAANAGGDTRQVVKTLHRIDPAVVRADFERAGFIVEGTSDMLRNPADDRTVGVFDEKIRGKTDRFVFRFRKPR